MYHIYSNALLSNNNIEYGGQFHWSTVISVIQRFQCTLLSNNVTQYAVFIAFAIQLRPQCFRAREMLLNV